MVRASLLALALVSLSTVVGCGASATRHSGTPHSPEGAVARDESSWCSPEEVEMKMLEKAAAHAPTTATQGTIVQSYRRNESLRPTKGAIHAATY